MNEPKIIVNGIALTEAQAMTVRVALGSFAIDLDKNGLGDDEVGRNICKGYQCAINDIFRIMMGTE